MTDLCLCKCFRALLNNSQPIHRTAHLVGPPKKITEALSEHCTLWASGNKCVSRAAVGFPGYLNTEQALHQPSGQPPTMARLAQRYSSILDF